MGLAAATELIRLDGRVAVVTGGGKGIGRGICLRLAEVGAVVVVADLVQGDADATADLIRDAGGAAHAVQVDVADEGSVVGLMRTVADDLGGVDVLVNNAGIFPMASVLELDAAEFDRVVGVNLRGAFLCIREAGRLMVAQGRGGAIVNVTSIDALHPSMVGLAAYDASKHGEWGFTKNVALELAQHGIRVNAVAPGAIDTPGARASGAGSDEAMAAFAQMVPLGRMGTPDDIARAVVFLASGMAGYMTGSQVVVDGGMLLR